MDVSTIGRFYGSIVRFPEGFAVPPGGLARFLREDLRAKVFLVSSGVFDDRWATHTRETLTADELFNIGVLRGLRLPERASRFIQSVLLYAVGFEGDNGPVERGVGPLQMALAQTEFLLLKCSESFMIQRSMDKTGFLDYEEYDLHRTVEMYFVSRWALELYEKVPVGAASTPEFNIGKRLEYWTEAERVDGEVISICQDSIDGVIADMVASTSPSASRSDKSQGIWEYVPSIQGSEHPMRSVAGSGYALVEEWTAGVKLTETKPMPRPDTPQALNATSYSIVECFSIIGWQAHRLQVRGYGPLHVVMGHFVRPAIFLLERTTEGLQTADWRYRLSESELRVLHVCIDLVVKVVVKKFQVPFVRSFIGVPQTLVIVRADRFPSADEITRGVCLDESTASLRGKDLSGLLRLHVLLLSFFADGIPPVPPADLDLWLSRGLIIAHSWELVEHISDYAVFHGDSADALLIGVELPSQSFPFQAGFPLPCVMTSESEEFEGTPLRAPLRHSVAFPSAYRFSETCMLLEELQISDADYALHEAWQPPIPVSDIVCRILRPSVFLLQRAVNPNFRDTIGFYHLLADVYDRFQQCIRKTLELMHLISLTSPIYPSYVEIWDGVSHILPDEAPVSDRSAALFDFMDEIVNAYGYAGCYDPVAYELEAALRHLRRVSRCWAYLLGTRGEYPEYLRSGRMIRSLPAIGW
ncbi:hypothetical protein DFH07DRAFT_780851 [Mycena maculata]|uniref:Uncharacterized protein n=1 Tax=Mycena maculata TaxID=230809 RepID=A0AAD7I103_9AGAR|nr:hypothetical protein DFH07DRAFT_780851 [Mycena maculata]